MAIHNIYDNTECLIRNDQIDSNHFEIRRNVEKKKKNNIRLAAVTKINVSHIENEGNNTGTMAYKQHCNANGGKRRKKTISNAALHWVMGD